jgi:beta-ureidopropionase / N-carbamoyl-L-amino-acid hydrolase
VSELDSSPVEIARQVRPDRVLDRLHILASIGAEKPAGITRIAFSDEDLEAMEVVSGWMREAGLTIAYDAFGNLFGSTDHNAPGAGISMAGSHIDTVRHAGTFDGTVGVVGAIESILAMRSCNCLPAFPLEVVVWRCEEPVRFAKGKVGSSLFAGLISLDTLRPTDTAFDLAELLSRTASATHRACSRSPSSYLELHIEQGRRLENAGLQIGVVTAVAAPTRLSIRIQGQADHSGATPMDDRRDAVCAAAELVLAIEQAGRAEAPHDSVATTANVTCTPGVINVIPGEAVLTVDVRGTNSESIRRVLAAIYHGAEAVSRARNVRIEPQVLSDDPPTHLDTRIIDVLSATVGDLGFAVQRMPSGAGHDAQPLAALCPAGMLFVPSVRGVSHSPEEYTRDDDVVAGVRSLAACWWRVAQDEYGRA